MAQNYASRPVTRIASGSATAAAIVQVSGLKSESQTRAAPSVEVLEIILALPVDQLKLKWKMQHQTNCVALERTSGLAKRGQKTPISR